MGRAFQRADRKGQGFQYGELSLGSIQGSVFSGGDYFSVPLWVDVVGLAHAAEWDIFAAPCFILHLLHLLYRMVVLYAGIQTGNLLGLVLYHFLYFNRMHASKNGGGLGFYDGFI